MEKINLTEDELVEGKHCLDLEIPWMVPEAVYKLDEVLKKTDRVVEIGAGGSTLFFLSRCESVLAIESSQEWAGYRDWETGCTSYSTTESCA